MTEILILAVVLPGWQTPIVGGFILIEAGTEEFGVTFRRDWSQLCDPDDSEVLGAFEETILAMAQEMGKRDLVAILEETFSNTIRCVDRMRLPSSMPLPERLALLSRALI